MKHQTWHWNTKQPTVYEELDDNIVTLCDDINNQQIVFSCHQSRLRTPSWPRLRLRLPQPQNCIKRRPWITPVLCWCARPPWELRRSWRTRRGTTERWAAARPRNCCSMTETSWCGRAPQTLARTSWRGCTTAWPNTCCWSIRRERWEPPSPIAAFNDLRVSFINETGLGNWYM